MVAAATLLVQSVGAGPSEASGHPQGALSWGDDFFGQLGDGGAHADRPTPVAVSGLGADSGVVAVAGGGAHSLAVRADGSVLAWGNDEFGQLGDGGANADRSTPVGVSGLGPGSGVVAVAAGEVHSLAVRADGSVLAWGNDEFGQLGDGGANVNTSTPVGVSGLGPGGGVASVVAGGAHSFAVRTDGSVLAWGNDEFGQLGDGGPDADQPTPVELLDFLVPGTGVVSLAAGGAHSLAVRPDGSVMAWGYNETGQLGDGQAGAHHSQPTPVPVYGLAPGSGVASVAAGDEHSLALRADGSAVAWGNDDSGQLGDGGANDFTQPRPVAVRGLAPGSGVMAVAAGGYHSLAVSPSSPRAAFLSVRPERLLDTRADGPQKGYTGPKPGAGSTVEVQATGSGATNAPSDAAAVVLNVTGVSATRDGFVTAWPCGTPRPLASNLNLTTGDIVPNLVISKVGAGGKVCLYTSGGSHLVADINGYFPAGTDYSAVSPERLLDTRADGRQKGYSGAGSTVEVQVTGTGTTNVPADAAAVVLNVTGVSATRDGFVTAWPCGTPRPLASNLNLTTGDILPNLVISKVGAGGKVCLYTSGGSHLVADINGYFPS